MSGSGIRPLMDRRTLLAALGGFAGASLAGCVEREDEDQPAEAPEDDDEDALRVVVREPFVRPENAPGRWLAERFAEDREDVEITWISPEAGLDYYLQRARYDVPYGADVYLGLDATGVVRAGQATPSVFRPLDRARLDNDRRVRFTLEDPHDRVLPFLADYACLLHGDDVEPPDSLRDLVEPAYADALIVPDARRSSAGRAFLHWTIAAFGPDEAFVRWRELRANRVRVERDWAAAAEAYRAGEGSLLVGRASRRITAGRTGDDPDRHRVAYPGGSGYAMPAYVGIFDGTPRRELAHGFVDALLSREVQAGLVARTDRFPAVSARFVDLPGAVEAFGDEPAASLSLGYRDLHGAQKEWLDRWAEAVGVAE